MTRIALLLVAALLVGCSKAPAPLGEGTSKAGRVIEVGRNKTTVFDSENRKVWSLSIKKAGVEPIGNQAAASFDEFSGELYHEGERAALISANSGSANSASGIIECKGGAKFASELYDTSIEADSIEWRSKEDLIVAAGNVKVRNGKFSLDAPGAVFADTAGDRVWVRSQEESMKLRAAMLGLGVAGTALAMPKHSLQYGNVTIDKLDSYEVHFEAKGRIHVLAKGLPLATITAPDQGLNATAKTIEADIVMNTKKKVYELINLKADGGFTFASKGLQANPVEGSTITGIAGQADSATYSKAESTIVLKGNVVVTMSGPDLEEPGAKGDGDVATVKLDPDTSQPLWFKMESPGGVGKVTATLKQKKPK